VLPDLGFRSAKTLFRSAKTFFRSAKTLFRSAKTLFRSAKTFLRRKNPGLHAPGPALDGSGGSNPQRAGGLGRINSVHGPDGSVPNRIYLPESPSLEGLEQPRYPTTLHLAAD
jgi:hypothetical protein